eukprot:NODE_36_length_36011_cov_1.012920.p23 type:complete len:116 gc:universal NODE_36_length_36011_cov_1.012920:2786-2439(-)
MVGALVKTVKDSFSTFFSSPGIRLPIIGKSIKVLSRDSIKLCFNENFLFLTSVMEEFCMRLDTEFNMSSSNPSKASLSRNEFEGLCLSCGNTITSFDFGSVVSLNILTGSSVSVT